MVSTHNAESMLRARRFRLYGFLALIAAMICCGFAYWLAWRSGCLVDAKTGLGGDGIKAGRFHWAASSAAVVAYFLLAMAIPVLSRSTRTVFFGSLIFLALTFVPLVFLMLAMASAAGSAACLY